MIIGIDCGHTLSGEGTGAQGCGYKEENLTRELGKIVMELLEHEGHSVINCTVDKSLNNSQQLKDRVIKADRQKLDLFVSIHFNASNGSGHGTEVLVHSTNSKATPYAGRICNNICKLGFRNRGVKTHGAYVLRYTDAPALLIETCFIDNKNDMELYTKNVRKVAKAIVEGILNKSIADVVETPKKGLYRVLAGSYKDRNNAVKKVDELKSKGITATIIYFE